MAKQLSNNAAAAKLIRAELKKHGIKGRVTSKSYSGGSSVDVSIKQDVLPATRDAITAFAEQFQYGHFDGMTDSYNYSNVRDDLPQVTYVFVGVDYSDKIRQAANDYVGNIEGLSDFEKDQKAWMALNGSWGDFWTDRKPRMQVAA